MTMNKHRMMMRMMNFTPAHTRFKVLKWVARDVTTVEYYCLYIYVQLSVFNHEGRDKQKTKLK